MGNPGTDTERNKNNVVTSVFDPAISRFVGFSQKLQNCLKSQLKNLKADKHGIGSSWRRDKESSSSSMQIDLEKQLGIWRENPSWTDQIPVIKVSIPKGSLCNLKAEVNVGLPPDAVYNIVIDPDNRRVFKNIKEVMSRKVLVDEGLRQVVEVEQAALWKFLWWSGTISVHVLVDQNRADHSMKFKQVKSGFMKRFEGSWQVKPLFVDEHMCDRLKPKTLDEYNRCTGGKGRIGSKVTLDQLIQPAIVPPPPISWYLRGITAKTTEMLIYDLLAETTRIRAAGEMEDGHSPGEQRIGTSGDIKGRWAAHRRTSRRRRNDLS
ncbi:PREDICTED: uncharacterized protein LOC104712594 [Camelina sativa]|uniref:Uncharacterized protein LOC104712594 n=1 Tax=Camelina sativa TaxID=90675 RepID=A0ABM0TKQ2_CAMSA|nr:PREDICTED: uncharacterized protein LOC104712594 [Camelina sativa]XP_010427824.1 PREDICTED: uncharacterized protein LOC104712594 [Camelina sativa]XP_010427825.1 PREDICTED: uncharacterized protein LOC104712594 [Camelina sativa]